MKLSNNIYIIKFNKEQYSYAGNPSIHLDFKKYFILMNTGETDILKYYNQLAQYLIEDILSGMRCIMNYKFQNFTKILIYKEFYQWVPIIPDFSNVFLGYYAKQTLIITGPRITGIIQKKYIAYNNILSMTYNRYTI